jgi:phosphodiesterase/alkaline phosphatase D-like protein
LPSVHGNFTKATVSGPFYLVVHTRRKQGEVFHRNRAHPELNFRVRILGLNSNTIYYYRVESAGATNVSDGVSSPVKTFKTNAHPG